MNAVTAQRDLALEPVDNERLANLCGPFDQHLRQLELRLGVEISSRGNAFRVIGSEYAVAVERLGLDEGELREVTRTALEGAFAEDGLRRSLLAVVDPANDR